MKKVSIWLLAVTESLFLWAHGWRKVGKDEWSPPTNYPFKRGKTHYHRGHALNSQRLEARLATKGKR